MAARFLKKISRQDMKELVRASRKDTVSAVLAVIHKNELRLADKVGEPWRAACNGYWGELINRCVNYKCFTRPACFRNDETLAISSLYVAE